MSGIEVPDELVCAHREGRLVLFVGAGTSRAEPSSLPDFEGLVRQIADDSGQEYPKNGAHPDVVLGRLKSERGVDVHRRVHEIIGSAESKPNSLHKAIMALALASPVPRIVTTNYDRHLSASVPNGVSVGEFTSPALPLGDDTRGIVYLHGSVSSSSEQLVVTDADFGRAYVSDGWAARFLRSMYRKFTVLFVGYSHGDTLMEYLAKGLPEESTRYALYRDVDLPEESPEHRRWHRLGIHPVAYRDHADLPVLIDRWVKLAQMRMLDHDRRVQAIVDSSMPLPLDDESYLVETIADAERVRIFAGYARELHWLQWIATQAQFRRLFDPLESGDEVTKCLARWLSEHYIANPDTTEDALRVFSSLGGRFSGHLWNSAVWALRSPISAGVAGTSRWIPLLATDIPAGSRSHLIWLLEEMHPVRDREIALLLFDRLVEPQVSVDNFGEISVISDDVFGRLLEYWNSQFVSHMQDLAPDLVRLIDRHLREAHNAIHVTCEHGNGWKLASWLRSAIEPHEQDDHSSRGLNLLIDVARDTLEGLFHSAPDVGEYYVRSWSDAREPLLQRLAIHGWTERDDVGADEKIDWLRRTDWIFDYCLRHEAMRLLRIALPDASGRSADSLVQYLAERSDSSSEDSERTVFSYLSWIVQHAPTLSSAQVALNSIQERHPDWVVSDHPDFLIWSETNCETIGPRVDSTELHEQIEEGAADAVAQLVQCRGNPDTSRHDWYDAIRGLETTVEEHPSDGLAVLEVLLDSGTGNLEADQDLAEAVLSVWSSTRRDDVLYSDIAPLLMRIWETGIKSWGDSPDSDADNLDWLGRAINHWAGKIAQIALHCAAAERRQTVEDRNELSDRTRAILEEMLKGNSKPQKFAQVVLASQIAFLYQVDELWCLDRILPLLDPKDNKHRAIRCWEGYLTWGRINQRLLEAGLIGFYVDMVSLLESISPRPRREFCRHLALNALVSGIDPLENGWLKQFTSIADSETRVQWIRHVGSELSALLEEQVEVQWISWMRTYWTDRLRSRPVAMTTTEASALAEWTVALGPRFPEGVELVLKHDATLTERSRIPYHLVAPERVPDFTSKFNYLAEYPEHAARLVAHLLSAIEGRNMAEHLSLSDIVWLLRDHVDETKLESLIDQCLRLGIIRPDEWRRGRK